MRKKQQKTILFKTMKQFEMKMRQLQMKCLIALYNFAFGKRTLPLITLCPCPSVLKSDPKKNGVNNNILKRGFCRRRQQPGFAQPMRI